MKEAGSNNANQPSTKLAPVNTNNGGGSSLSRANSVISRGRGAKEPGASGHSHKTPRHRRRPSLSADMGKKRTASRSIAMVEDLMGDVEGAGVKDDRGGVPKWLVEQQAKHARDDSISGVVSEGTASGGKGKGKGGGGRSGKFVKRTSGTDNDYFVMVDLLDASHVPTSTGEGRNSSPEGHQDETAAEEEKGVVDERRGKYSGNASLKIDADERSKDAREVAARWKRNVDEPRGEDEQEIKEKSDLRGVNEDVSPPKIIPVSSIDSLQSRGEGSRGGQNFGDAAEEPNGDERTGFLGSLMNRLLHSQDGEEHKVSEKTRLLQAQERKGMASLLASDESLKSGRKHEHLVYPSQWEWRRPADEDTVIPSFAWLYLALIGWITFALCYAVTFTSDALIVLLRALSSFLEKHLGWNFGFAVLASSQILFAVSSFLFVRKVSPRYANGSGIPEMKCVLSGVYMPKALSGATLMAKLVGLTFSLASGLSIGKLGPFMHISGMAAAFVSRMSWFPNLQTSARSQLQAVSAAMAAGVGATLGAPIGATLLSIELMSTYYYIHWIPIALYCAVMGYGLVVAVFRVDQIAYFYSSFDTNFNEHELERVIIYGVLGVICGSLGALLVSYTTKMFVLRKRYVPDKSFRGGILLMAIFTLIHTGITAMCAGVLAKDQKAGVVNLFNTPAGHTEFYTALPSMLHTKHFNAIATLFIAVIVKFLLTGISLILPIPAGTFIPIFEIGALAGRLFGEALTQGLNLHWLDPRATAIVGAAAMTAGTLHITSIAVIMLELTMNAVNVLPLVFCVVISYGVSKSMCADLFSELIKLRKLPFILGIRERYPHETRRFYRAVSTVTASCFMSTDFPFVTPQTTKGEARRLLSSGYWSTCAFLSSKQDRKLLGTISRTALAHAVAIPSTLAHARARDVEKGEGWKVQKGRGSSGTSIAQGGDYGSCVLGTLQVLNDQELVPFLANFDADRGHRNVDMGPMIVGAHTPFWKVTTYFRMLGMGKMYVIKEGKCVGYLTKAHVIRSSFEIEEEARKEEASRKDLRVRHHERTLSRRQSTANFANFDKIFLRRNGAPR